MHSSLGLSALSRFSRITSSIPHPFPSARLARDEYSLAWRLIGW